MGDVAITALVYIANTSPKTPINGLTGINFIGLEGADTGVEAIANGEYILSFDDTLTGRICCTLANYQENCQQWTNQAVLQFAMAPSGGGGGGSIGLIF